MPLLREFVTRATEIGVAIGRWVREHQGLIVSVFKIIGGLTAAGAAIVALGGAVKAIGVGLGLMSTAITVAGAILSALLSPIGLVVAALGVGVAAFLMFSDTGGAVVDWLKARFSELAGFFTESLGAMGEALAAGNLGAAANVLWAVLKVAWVAGTNAIKSIWTTALNSIIKIGIGAFYGVMAAWEIMTHGIEVAWIETTAFLSRIWTNFTSGIQSAWESTQSWLENCWHDLFKLFDSTYDADAAKALNNRLSANKQKEIEDARTKALGSRETERQAERGMAGKQFDRNMGAIGQAYNDKSNALDAEAKTQQSEAQKEFDKAMADWKSAVGQAQAAGRTMTTPNAPGGPTMPKMPEVDVDGLVKRTTGVTGTFSSAALGGLAGSGVNDRLDKIIKATVQTATNIRALGFGG
jgi:hypothetical protein